MFVKAIMETGAGEEEGAGEGERGRAARWIQWDRGYGRIPWDKEIKRSRGQKAGNLKAVIPGKRPTWSSFSRTGTT